MTATAGDWAIDLRDVAKIYKGRIHALQGIEMRVRRGEVFGLLGPNGAGKSTLVKIMMTVIRPTRAGGTLLGRPVGHKPTLRRVGYLPENHRFPKYLTGRQTLEFFGAMSDVDRPTRKRRAAELLATVGMSDWGGKKISTYSKGMLQRVGLAQALMPDPDLVVLDEPTDGVDPVGRRDIQVVLRRLRDEGKTVFINSHQLSELEAICDRVAILVRGQVARQGTIDELTRNQQRYEVELAGPDPAAWAVLRPRLLGALRETGAVITETSSGPATPPLGGPPPLASQWGAGTTAAGRWLEVHGPLVQIGTTDAVEIQPMLDAIRGAGLTIRRVQAVRQSLEDLFMAAVEDPGNSGRALPPGAAVPGAPAPAGRAGPPPVPAYPPPPPVLPGYGQGGTR